MNYIVWIGTEDNPKSKMHRAYENEKDADDLIDYLERLFGEFGVVVTKEVKEPFDLNPHEFK